MAEEELATLTADIVDEAMRRHRENSATYFDALQQIVAACRDNAGPNCRHDMALDFVLRVALRALPKR